MELWTPKNKEEKQWAEELLIEAEKSIGYKVATYLKKVLENKDKDVENEGNTVQGQTNR